MNSPEFLKQHSEWKDKAMYWHQQYEENQKLGKQVRLRNLRNKNKFL